METVDYLTEDESKKQVRQYDKPSKKEFVKKVAIIGSGCAGITAAAAFLKLKKGILLVVRLLVFQLNLVF